MTRVLRTLMAMSAALCLLLLIALAGLLSYARATGSQLVVVTGGSMEPTYGLGEGLVIRPLRDGELRPGTVITYRSLESATLTTHRVLSLHTIDGAPHVRTQGDANATADPNLTPVDAIAGSPVAHVPHGDRIAWLALSPRGRLLLFGPPLLLLVGLESHRLRQAWRTAAARDVASAAAATGLPVTAPSVDLPVGDRGPGDDGSARVRQVVASVLALGLVGAAASVDGSMRTTGASFADAQSLAGNSFTTASLAAPTALTAVVSTMSVNLSWTTTASTFASGYEVLRGTATGGPYAVIGSLTGRATTSFSDTMASGTVFYIVRASYQNWTSPSSNQVTATTGSVITTPYGDCATTAPDTGGRLNGYEVTPVNACRRNDAGATATDVNSGTNKVRSCTDAGKDRHRFLDYGLAVPASAVGINGIQVELRGSPSTLSGTSRVCVELSGDGGTTWTVPRSIDYLSTTQSVFSLGGPTDLWGTTWTPARLDNVNFRVRLTNVDTNANKDFRLDYVSVSVTYRS